MILLDPGARPVIGHRGSSGNFPENTLLSLREAIDGGADAVEFDVRAAADGTPVVIHDPTLDRTTDGTGLVKAMSVEQLRSFDAGRGEKIPTLDEALEQIGATPFILEIKEAAVARSVKSRIDAHSCQRSALLGSFVHSALAPFDRDRYYVSASQRVAAAFYAASRVGLGMPGGFKGFCLSEYHHSLKVVDSRFVRVARESGKPVHVWTVNEPSEARALWELGVAGIISNFPSEMLGERDG